MRITQKNISYYNIMFMWHKNKNNHDKLLNFRSISVSISMSNKQFYLSLILKKKKHAKNKKYSYPTQSRIAFGCAVASIDRLKSNYKKRNYNAIKKCLFRSLINLICTRLGFWKFEFIDATPGLRGTRFRRGALLSRVGPASTRPVGVRSNWSLLCLSACWKLGSKTALSNVRTHHIFIW